MRATFLISFVKREDTDKYQRNGSPSFPDDTDIAA